MPKNPLIKNKKTSRKRLALIVIGVVIVLLALLFASEKMHVTHFFTSKPMQTANQDTKGEAGVAPSPPGSKTPPTKTATPNQSSPGDNKGSGGSTSSAPLKAPSGEFVSNYTPNLSGNPKPNLIASVCTTTSGAICRISFTKDGVVKTLPDMTTDRGGSAYWTWKLQDIGLTTGSWKIKATAELNGKTVSTDDPLTLDVKE